MEFINSIRECDLLIIGSSMAGGCLARQMKLKHPDMDIVVLDRKFEFKHWVGESTLESFWDYAVKYLDLGYYLDTNHLYKHGLRFFYDSPDHDLPIDQMSEVGRSWFHSTPAHQLDRKRFDSDLYEMNIKSGIDVRLGVTVRHIELDKESGHLLKTTGGEFKCRWLVDAAGLASPLGKKLDLIQPNEDHPINSYWGRFKNIANLDLLGDMAWRERVNHTTRALATTHFMYGGYWIWLIPIDAETFSIGLTNRTNMANIEINSQEDFIAFLKQHRCMRQLLTDQFEICDFNKLKNISRQSKQIFSEDRWFMTGMSGAILDPLLSPGSAFLADTNRKIGDLIATDMAGDERAVKNKVIAYNAHTKHWLENFFLHIKGHYHQCYDRQRVNFETLLIQWFGIILPASMCEYWGYDPMMTDEQVEMIPTLCDKMICDSRIHKVDAVIHEFENFLKNNSLEFENNRGQYYDLELPVDAMINTRTSGRDLNPIEIKKIEEKMVWVAIKRCLTRMAEVKGLMVDGMFLNEITDEAHMENLNLEQAFMLLKVKNNALQEIINRSGIAENSAEAIV